MHTDACEALDFCNDYDYLIEDELRFDTVEKLREWHRQGAQFKKAGAASTAKSTAELKAHSAVNSKVDSKADSKADSTNAANQPSLCQMKR